ncbi:MAG: acyltransferase [Beijerinckiaceae bacterium]|jgi:peptidoglycan/LPS O-acetylase OafA/YrhL|nr:acyltransferase [Beijerinckiaceae bacterium]
MSKDGSAEVKSPLAGSPPGLSHLAPLDGLRGVAVLLVIFAQTPFILEWPATRALQDMALRLSLGHFGVDLFFVLSGFLITRILLSDIDTQGRIGFRNFYIRRMLRIFPAYLISIAVYLLCFEAKGLWSLLTYTFNIYHPFNPGPHPLENTWSLSVEEQFYLVWPFLIAALPRAAGWRVTAFFVPGIALTIAIAIALIVEGPLAGELIYRSTPVRMMSLSLGAALAYRELAGRPLPERACWLLMVGGVSILAMGTWLRARGLIDAQGDFQVLATFGFTLVSAGVVALILAPSGAFAPHLQSWLTARWLRAVGKISYGLYIYRSLILYLLGIPLHHSQVHGAPALLVAAFLLLSFGLAALSYHVVEAPILRLKSRLTGAGEKEGASPEAALQPIVANR